MELVALFLLVETIFNHPRIAGSPIDKSKHFSFYLLKTYSQNDTQLHLSRMNISSIPVNAFQSLSGLEILELSQNNLTYNSLPCGSLNITTLRRLNIASNQLTTVPICLPTALEFLDLRKNVIQWVNFSEFMDLHKLKILLLSHNNISKIGSSGTKLPHIVSLDLSYNNFTRSQWKFQGPNLRTLRLEGNPLQEISPYEFNPFPKLRYLNLSSTSLESCSYKAFASEKKSIETLDLSENLFKTFDPQCFEGLSNLQILWMRRMPFLQSLPDDLFLYTSNLTQVNLEENSQLHFVKSSMFEQLPHLQTLSLKSCNLTEFRPWKLFTNSTIKITLSGNHLVCSCELAWLIKEPEKTFLNRANDTGCVKYGPQRQILLPGFIDECKRNGSATEELQTYSRTVQNQQQEHRTAVYQNPSGIKVKLSSKLPIQCSTKFQLSFTSFTNSTNLLHALLLLKTPSHPHSGTLQTKESSNNETWNKIKSSIKMALTLPITSRYQTTAKLNPQTTTDHTETGPHTTNNGGVSETETYPTVRKGTVTKPYPITTGRSQSRTKLNPNIRDKVQTEPFATKEKKAFEPYSTTGYQSVTKLHPQTIRDQMRAKLYPTTKYHCRTKRHSLTTTKETGTEPHPTREQTGTEPHPTREQTGTEPHPLTTREENGTEPHPLIIREQTGTKPLPNREQTGTEPHPTREQTGTKPHPNREHSGTEPHPTREQTGSEPLPTREQTGSEPLPTREQTGTEPLPLIIREQTGTEPLPTTKQSATEPLPTREQTGTVPLPNREQTGTEPHPTREQTGTEPLPTREQTGTVPLPNREQTGTEPHPTREQTGTVPLPNREQTGTEPLPTREQTGTVPHPTREQTGTEPLPTREQIGTEPHPTTNEQIGTELHPHREQAGTKPLPNREQTGSELLPTREQIGTEPHPTTREQTGTEPHPLTTREQTGTEPHPNREQIGTEPHPTREQTGTEPLPTREQTGTELHPTREQTGTEPHPTREQTGTEPLPLTTRDESGTEFQTPAARDPTWNKSYPTISRDDTGTIRSQTGTIANLITTSDQNDNKHYPLFTRVQSGSKQYSTVTMQTATYTAKKGAVFIHIEDDDTDSLEKEEITSPTPGDCNYDPCRHWQVPCHDLQHLTGCLCPVIAGEDVIPDPVKIQKVMKITDNSAEIFWCAPSSTVMYYYIIYQSDDNKRLYKTDTIKPTYRRYTLRDLTADSTYHTCVVAVNKAGPSTTNSIWSSKGSCYIFKTKPNYNNIFYIASTVIIAILFILVITLSFCLCKIYQRGRLTSLSRISLDPLSLQNPAFEDHLELADPRTEHTSSPDSEQIL
ncbi:uncharacterized protein LOC132403035 [Hypanus sabinus]|uniref:uncharacterized protein LOC132403035 n=1 Tax=Hypanus sabinus TaxID=79690 RepID=UPI0028C4AC94|nr:uncharacterized protein LOC132403035 [Hypanus sabinus]